MALQSSAIKAKFKQRIYNGLKREFSGAVAKGSGFPPIADGVWMQLADAISDIAMDLVEEIRSNAEVLPGIPTPTGATTGKGKIT
jgi:hypothetical protein